MPAGPRVKSNREPASREATLAGEKLPLPFQTDTRGNYHFAKTNAEHGSNHDDLEARIRP